MSISFHQRELWLIHCINIIHNIILIMWLTMVNHATYFDSFLFTFVRLIHFLRGQKIEEKKNYDYFFIILDFLLKKAKLFTQWLWLKNFYHCHYFNQCNLKGILNGFHDHFLFFNSTIKTGQAKKKPNKEQNTFLWLVFNCLFFWWKKDELYILLSSFFSSNELFILMLVSVCNIDAFNFFPSLFILLLLLLIFFFLFILYCHRRITTRKDSHKEKEKNKTLIYHPLRSESVFLAKWENNKKRCE